MHQFVPDDAVQLRGRRGERLAGRGMVPWYGARGCAGDVVVSWVCVVVEGKRVNGLTV